MSELNTKKNSRLIVQTIGQSYQPQSNVQIEKSLKSVSFTNNQDHKEEIWKMNENRDILTEEPYDPRERKVRQNVQQAHFQVNLGCNEVIAEETEEDSSHQNESQEIGLEGENQSLDSIENKKSYPLAQGNNMNFERTIGQPPFEQEMPLLSPNESSLNKQEQENLSAIKQSIRSRLSELENKIAQRGQSDLILKKEMKLIEDTESQSEFDEHSNYSRSAKANSIKQTPRIVSSNQDYAFLSGEKKFSTSQDGGTSSLSENKSEFKFVSGQKDQNVFYTTNKYERIGTPNQIDLQQSGTIPSQYSPDSDHYQFQNDLNSQHQESDIKLPLEQKYKYLERKQEGEKDKDSDRDASSFSFRNKGEDEEFQKYIQFEKNQVKSSLNQERNIFQQQNVRILQKQFEEESQKQQEQEQEYQQEKDEEIKSASFQSEQLKNQLNSDLDYSKQQHLQLQSIKQSIEEGLKNLRSKQISWERKQEIKGDQHKQNKSLGDIPSDFKAQLSNDYKKQILQNTNDNDEQKRDKILNLNNYEPPTQKQVEVKKSEQIIPQDNEETQQINQESKENVNNNQDLFVRDSYLVRPPKVRKQSEDILSTKSQNQSNLSYDKQINDKDSRKQQKSYGIQCGRLQVKSIKDYTAAEEAEKEWKLLEKDAEIYQQNLHLRKKEIESIEAKNRLQKTIADCIRVYIEQRKEEDLKKEYKLNTSMERQTVKIKDTQQNDTQQRFLENQNANLIELNQPKNSKVREIISIKVNQWIHESNQKEKKNNRTKLNNKIDLSYDTSKRSQKIQ